MQAQAKVTPQGAQPSSSSLRDSHLLPPSEFLFIFRRGARGTVSAVEKQVQFVKCFATRTPAVAWVVTVVDMGRGLGGEYGTKEKGPSPGSNAGREVVLKAGQMPGLFCIAYCRLLP